MRVPLQFASVIIVFCLAFSGYSQESHDGSPNWPTFPIDTDAGHISIPIKISDQTFAAAFDTGCTVSLIDGTEKGVGGLITKRVLTPSASHDRLPESPRFHDRAPDTPRLDRGYSRLFPLICHRHLSLIQFSPPSPLVIHITRLSSLYRCCLARELERAPPTKGQNLVRKKEVSNLKPNELIQTRHRPA